MKCHKISGCIVTKVVYKAMDEFIQATSGRAGMPVKIIALALGVAGWITYAMIWLGVRMFGSVTLTFGKWGPGWLKWIELWVEPLIIISWLAFLVWVLWREISRAGDGE